MAYCREIDTHQYENFIQELNEWNEDIERIDPHSHRQYCYGGYHSFDQTSAWQLPGTFVDIQSPSQHMRPTYYGSPSTLYDSSSSNSDRTSPPVGSPASSFLRTPELYNRDIPIPPLGMNTYTLESDYSMQVAGSCVAMQYVQKCADAQFEETMDDFGNYETVFEPQELVPATREEDEPSSSTPYYHHHHQIPVASAQSSQNNVEPDLNTKPESEPMQTPPIRHNHRQRRTAKESPLLAASSSKVTERSSTRSLNLRSIFKRTMPSRSDTQPRARNQRIKAEDEEDEPANEAQPPLKPFPCPLAPYGCTASFNAKNEWKRHATTQHFRLGFWRCDLCKLDNKTNNNHKNGRSNSNVRKTPNAAHNEFNRKDLFMQHVRRMHPESIKPLDATTPPLPKTKPSKTTKTNTSTPSQTSLTSLTSLTLHSHHPSPNPTPPATLCPFCPETFPAGPQGLESRLEHMGKHMDLRRKEGLGPVGIGEWRRDLGLEGWLGGM